MLTTMAAPPTTRADPSPSDEESSAFAVLKDNPAFKQFQKYQKVSWLYAGSSVTENVG